MTNNINFKGMLKRVSQQDQVYSANPSSRFQKEKENKETSAKENPYKFLTTRLESQQFSKGQLKGPHSNVQPHQIRQKQRDYGFGKRRNRQSSHSQMECNQQLGNPHLIQPRNHIAQNHQISMISSNNQAPSLFESKLCETKDLISQQITDLQQKFHDKLEIQHKFIEQYIDRKLKQNRHEYQNGFAQIVNQLNSNLESIKSKNKQAITIGQENRQTFLNFQTKYNQYVIQVDEKLEKLLNAEISNSSVARSMNNQANMSYAGDYAMDLKSSIKDISCQNANNQNPNMQNILEIEEYKNKIEEVQEEIKALRAEFSTLNTQIEYKKQIQQIKRGKSQEATSIGQTKLELKSFEAKIEKQLEQIKNQSTCANNKLKELRQISQIQQMNIKGINDQFTKVHNQQLLPRIRNLEQTNHSNQNAITNLGSEFKAFKLEIPSSKSIKKQLLTQLQPAKILRACSASEVEKTKIIKAKQKKEQLDAYMLDQDNNLMDCYGTYLLDEKNCRIKLGQQQVHYLVNFQQMAINSVV